MTCNFSFPDEYARKKTRQQIQGLNNLRGSNRCKLNYCRSLLRIHEEVTLKYRNLSLAVIFIIVALTSGAVYLVSELKLDYNFENFFPQDDPESQFYFDFRDAFETDNDFAVIGLGNNEGVFKADFLARVDSLTKDVEKLESVIRVMSPTSLVEMYRGAMGEPHKVPLLHLNNPELLQADSLRIFRQDQFIGTFFSADAKAVAIQITHEQFLSKEGCDDLADGMEALLEKYRFDEEHMLGRAIGQKVYVEMMFSEMVIFMSLSMILIVVLLIVAFRSAWGVLIPLLVVMLSIIWSLAIMKLIGVDIDLMLTILPTILFVVGMSDVVHIMSKYFEELRIGKPKIDAVKVAFKEVGMATFLTSLTTAIGFLTLMTSSIKPISNFGLYTAIGVFVAFILAYSLLPAVMILTKPPKAALIPSSKVFWTVRMHRTFGWVLRSRAKIMWVSVIFIGLSVFGATLVTVNNYMLEDLKEDHPLKQEFRYFETFLTGARPFEMGLVLDDSTEVSSAEFLDFNAKLDDWLKANYGVRGLMSPAEIVKQANYYAHNGNVKFKTIPESEKELGKLMRNIAKFDKEGLWNLVYSDSMKTVRLTGKVGDFGRTVYTALNDSLAQFFANNTPAGMSLSPRVTGTAHLIDVNNERLSLTMLEGLAIAFLVIALIVGIMFKSIKMVLISLIPNVIPLVVIAGIMGYFGIYLKVSTSIIFTIAFGIAVDDTIHYLSKFKIELSKGRSWQYALKRTSISTGKAIVVTTLILCGGFLTLIFSDFMGTFYIGLLIGLTLIFAVLSDLVLLPVLIIAFFSKKKDSSHKS
ncbi:MAG: putative RND superfamily exporter protein [Flavobacteriales bacterium]|jgi:predicted RND superfamily exporter protein